MSEIDVNLRWERVLDPDELGEGRVQPVTCHHATVCA